MGADMDGVGTTHSRISVPNLCHGQSCRRSGPGCGFRHSRGTTEGSEWKFRIHFLPSKVHSMWPQVPSQWFWEDVLHVYSIHPRGRLEYYEFHTSGFHTFWDAKHITLGDVYTHPFAAQRMVSSALLLSMCRCNLPAKPKMRLKHGSEIEISIRTTATAASSASRRRPRRTTQVRTDGNPSRFGSTTRSRYKCKHCKC